MAAGLTITGCCLVMPNQPGLNQPGFQPWPPTLSLFVQGWASTADFDWLLGKNLWGRAKSLHLATIYFVISISGAVSIGLRARSPSQ